MEPLTIVFLLITLATLAISFMGSGRDRQVLFSFFHWGLLVALLGSAGFFQNTSALPPRMLLVIIPATLLMLYHFRRLDIQKLKPSWLIAIHLVRLPVELVLYELFLRGEIPQLMTFAGWNYDIVMGITALLLLGYLWGKGSLPSRQILLAWNILGLILLGIIVTLALLSAPSPFQQLAFDQPNQAILRFPFTLLPGVVVPLVLLAHLWSIKLLRNLT